MKILFRLRLIFRDLFKVHLDRMQLKALGNPIVVYQMPKTGSAAITESLKRSGYPNSFHIHKLHPDDNYPFKYSQRLAHLLYSKVSKKQEYIRFITCVRDPIARNVSDLFQILKITQRFHKNNLDAPYSIDYPSNFNQNGKLTLEQLKKIFLENYPYHDLPLNWFDNNINKTLGIDVYKYRFPKDMGYLRIKEKNIDILILQLELEDSIKEKKIQDFLGDTKFKIHKTNITSEEDFDYSDMYLDFIKQTKFPAHYVNKMYNSKYMNNFYTNEQITIFKDRWLLQ